MDRPIYNLIAFRHFYGKEFLLSTRQLRPAPTPSKKFLQRVNLIDLLLQD